MNILLFVMTFLMVLSLMSYARWQTYRSFSGFKAEFEHYMKETERGFYNARAKKWYEETPATKKEGSENSHSSQAISRLTFYPILKREKDYPLFVELAKRLMRLLYGSQRFFKEAEEKDPNILDEILSQLTQIYQNLPKDKQITQASDLANLDLNNPELNDIFCKMLRGTPRSLETTQLPSQETTEEETGSEAKEDGEEYTSDTGYYSLLDYISMKNKPKIRVYLASRELLLAIYGDPAAVESIIQERNALYKQVADGGVKPPEATKIFQAALEGKSQFNAILDFGVTKTNPKQYE
jgi:hypothetical protein